MRSSPHIDLPEKAMETALSGFRVVPWQMKGGRKVPLIKQWQRNGGDYREQTKAWWRKWRQANVGVATGKQPNGLNVFVVDCDVKDGKTGPDTWAGLQEKHGSVPETLCVSTPSDGQNYWFTYPEGVTISNAQEKWPGIDIRGEGGYAGIYGKVGSGEYKITHGMLCPDDIAPAPGWLVDLLADEPKQTRPLRVPMEPSKDVGEVILQRALGRVAAGAGRNDTGFYLATQARDNRLSRANALALGSRFVEGVRHSKGHAYTNAEMEASIEQAYNRAPREPWSNRPAPVDPTGARFEKLPENGHTPPQEAPKTQGQRQPGTPYHQTDLGNAERMVDLFEGEIRYAFHQGKWYIWNGQFWAVDDTGEIQRRAEETIMDLWRTVGETPEAEQRKRLVKHASASESARSISAIDLTRARKAWGSPQHSSPRHA